MNKRASAIARIATAVSAVAVVLILTVSAFANAAVINGTTVAGGQLTITGAGFSGTPLTVTFNGKKLVVLTQTATQIVAMLSPIPAPGSYRLGVKAGNAAATSYVAISPFPTVVAQVALAGQTAPIPPTTILTPQTNGSYRVSAYIVTTTPATNGDPIYLNLTYTDDSGGKTLTILYLNSGTFFPNNEAEVVFAVRANAGIPLAYSISCDPYCSGFDATYELFLTVEQLQ
jgi:hypothetical protein